ncbi:acetyl/propionyl/methylcrotonyl-CoA carboxylase subunit alpha [Dactylosporangium sucinum]|uniref:biotin carboxylase n=1 Tax=Dactylosporangium sucinum TaxID=1424081 RepID=A0A917UEH1_9ACTN|nr:biotin carboxylase N-terminal domain-containing protein [Dactylosporangium sucinum]GGM82707.1 acetyl/propionyl-CoA carboxylase subuit alpha [Dactylosporangium sucinum]
MITTLLVANRGEIARRVMRTAAAMGIRTVAVYSDGDAHSPFVRDADLAVPLHGQTAAETYLDVAKVLDAARLAGADGVHPGYGFLSENADFARAVVEAGMIWVGPTPAAIAAMGDKLAAKTLMEEAGVRTLPSLRLEEGADLGAAATEVGFPALVKAAAGGGGKGMRVVEREEELQAAIAGARREALAAFGDGTVFLERYLTGARHVEVQILGDKHGNLVHLFERECSIQRRHQKVIEESPSSAVSPALRERMGQAGLLAAKAIGYESAGTVEFLLAPDGAFYFLEVNTRLQVEHPVTEMVTGLDLVREQLLVAQGAALSFTQSDLTLTGHAVEARLYAEDPDNDFLPVTGTVRVWEPAASPEARYDSGIESGSRVGVEFDPMLAKVIAHAPTRAEAALRLALALERTAIQGTTTNRDFLVATLRHPAFLAGDTSTDFITKIDPPRSRAVAPAELEVAAVQAALAAQSWRRATSALGRFPSGWRNSILPSETFTYLHADRSVPVAYRALRDGSFAVTVAGRTTTARVLECSDREIEVELDGIRHRSTVRNHGPRWWVHGPRGDVELALVPRFPEPEAEGVAGGLVAPLPGAVIAVQVTAGGRVEEGQLLVIVEAMKMEHRITAPHAGTVAELRVAAGDQVAAGDLLVVLEEA